MIEINCQISNDGRYLKPASQEDLDKLKEISPNQIVRCKITGHKKPRSVEQNRWVHAMFRLVADNCEDFEWDAPQKVKNMVKMKMGFYDVRFVVNDQVFFELRSFAFDSLGQDEANRVFNEAKRICADKLGVPEDVLEAQAKEMPF